MVVDFLMVITLPSASAGGLELTLGIGYAWLDYKEYYCTYCAELRGKKNRHYLGPTRAGVSLIYFIK